ncbi:hypothetical protein BGZ47_007739 [Haplosporangium gracile]|nr:hypothetical protein BGZ47_007739 [Haplosporangium gracile]
MAELSERFSESNGKSLEQPAMLNKWIQEIRAGDGVDAELEILIEPWDTKKSEIEQEYEALSLRVVELEHELEGLRQQQQIKAGDHAVDDVAKIVETIEMPVTMQGGSDIGAEKKTMTTEGEQ